MSESRALAVIPATDFPWPFRTPPMRAWTYSGMLCAIAKSPLYGVNGYVRIPEGSPLHGIAYDALDVRVSGGLTYGCFSFDAHPEYGIKARSCGTDETKGWVGFDTQHSWDYWDRATIVELGQRTDLTAPTMFERANYWTVELVEAETQRLAEQLSR